MSVSEAHVVIYSVCLSACLSIYLLACLPVCLSACLPVCLSVSLSVFLFLCQCPSECLLVFLSVSWSGSQSASHFMFVCYSVNQLIHSFILAINQSVNQTNKQTNNHLIFQLGHSYLTHIADLKILQSLNNFNINNIPLTTSAPVLLAL